MLEQKERKMNDLHTPAATKIRNEMIYVKWKGMKLNHV